MTEETKVLTPEAVDPNVVLAQLLEAVQSLKVDQERQKAEFERDKANLVAQLETVKHDAASNAAGAPRVLPDDAIDPRTDRPETNIEVKLDCMAAIAELNNEPFDRERNHRIMLGLPVEELYPYRFGGKVFEDEAEMDAYKEKLEVEKARTLGKFR
jgi:hypothetical protein